MKIPRRFVAEGLPAFTLCAPQRRPGGLPLRTPNHFHPALCRKGMTVCVRESTGLASRGCYPENTAQVCSGRPPGLHFVRTTTKARRSSATHTEPFSSCVVPKGMTVCVRESTGLASRGCYPENTAQVCSGRPPGLHFVRTTTKARRSSATHTE